MPVIEKGSTVLVTGVNGFIGSHIAEQLLQAGFIVRGTARTETKGKWLKELLESKYGAEKVELAVVPDMAVEGAFDEAVKGCSGVVHVASNLTFKPDPNEIIPSVIAGINETLKSADREPKVKRFVFTSSSTAATNPIPNKKFSIDEKSWNNECVERAWAPPPYEDSRKWDVYGASKTQAEQALWKFVDERKPHFEVNAVLPNANLGTILDPKNQDASTAGWIVSLHNNNMPGFEDIPPQWFINVQDTALLHVAALTDPSISHERIFGFAQPYTWNEILRILRKLRPNHKFPSDINDKSKDLCTVVPRARAEEILRRNFGLPGFTSLEESLKQNIAHLE